MSSLKRPLAVLAALASVALLAGCGDDESGSGTEAGGTSCDYPADQQGASKQVDPPSKTAQQSGDVTVTFATSIGELHATLDADAAPCTVNSIVSLAEQGYYDDTSCHRLTTSPGFGVLQCGDPTGSGMGGPGYTIPDELEQTTTYPAGTLAMANTGQPDTGGSQFFICYTDTDLPPQYTVFGTIDEASNELVTEAAAAGTTDGGPDGAPKTAVDFTTVTVG